MKTFSTLVIVFMLVILYGFVKVKPVDQTGKHTQTPTPEFAVTRKPVMTRPPTVTPAPYPPAYP